MNDRLPVRVGVIALAIGFLGSLFGIAWLASTQTPIPDALSDMPLYTGGALAALLPGALPRQQPIDPPAAVAVAIAPDDDSNPGPGLPDPWALPLIEDEPAAEG